MLPLVFILLNLVGGSNSTVVKFAVTHFPPLILVALRALIAFSVLTPFVLGTRKLKLGQHAKQLLFVNLLFAANWVSFAIGIQKTSVTLSQLMYVPTSLIVALLSYLILKEKFTKIQVIGLTVTIFGAFILALESISGENLTFGDPLGNLIVFTGVICWASYLVFSKKISNIYSPLTIIFFNFVVSFIIALLLIPLNSSARNFSFTNITPQAYLSLFYIGLVASVSYFYLNQWFVKHTSAFIASLQIYPLTIIAAVLGSVFYDEVITPSLIISALLIMSGVFIATSYNYLKGQLKWIFR